MRITDIVRTKRGHYSIYLDGEFYCALHADFAWSLAVGDEITQEKIDGLHSESEYKRTRERALKLLAQRSYTEQDLYGKLLKYADEQSAAAATARMIELGLLNDADYARRYAADCLNLKGFSLRKISAELLRKGIAREIIDDVLAELEDDPEPAIAKLIQRKYARCLEDEKGRARAINGLLRLGYLYNDIATVLRNLAEDDSYYEDS